MSTANLPNTTALTQALDTTITAIRPGFFGRLGSWLRKSPVVERAITDADAPETGGRELAGEIEAAGEPTAESCDLAAPSSVATASFGGPGPHEPRGTFLRPWAKRDVAIENLQQGLGALAELMTGIKESFEKQSTRQDELLGYLSHLPEALRQLPESSRFQGETLRAIHQQIEQQNGQQGRVADILERISRADDEQGRALDALSRHDAAISESLGRVSEVMQAVGANSDASARVLQQLRDDIDAKDDRRGRQNARLTALVSAAVTLSVAAMGAAAAVGYALVAHMH